MRHRPGPGLGVLSVLLLLVAHALSDSRTALPQPIEHVYAVIDTVELKAYVFRPLTQSPDRQRLPAIAIFHGGGWTMGDPRWAFPHARHFAELGLVAVAVQYRLSDEARVTPIEAMADARAVIRWMRFQANSLGIDPRRIAAYGWSAGAHLAASAAVFDTSGSGLSAMPNALILVSPAVSVASDRWLQHLLGARARAEDISPADHVRADLPPTLILQGGADTVTPLGGAERFFQRMQDAGNPCELHVYDGFGHLFTPAGVRDDEMPQPDSATAADALARADRFLQELGFVE